MMKFKQLIMLLAVAICSNAALADNPDWDPSPSYYTNATGTGSTLNSQLLTITSTGHIQRQYGNFRDSAKFHDAHPTLANQIFLAYNRANVSGNWDSGGTWNREHVWPVSRQPGTSSNSRRGNLGDPHALRPCNPSINSSRGNKPFGLPSSVGVFGSKGSYYFPGDQDKGDIARSLFYSSTRYSLALVNGFPSGNQMGDLAALLVWHYSDTPDEFERRRNHVISSQQYNPNFYTNNRNPFVDHPEFVWTIFGDGLNDSTIYVGASPAADGGSTLDPAGYGKVILNSLMPADVAVNISKQGADPTYYEIYATGDAYSSINSRYNAFPTGSQSNSVTVGLNGNTNSVGLISGTVVIDNLDVSTEGTGQGSADADDIINLNLQVVRPSNPSLDDVVVNKNLVLAETVDANSPPLSIHVPIYNLGYDADQALLDIDSVGGLGSELSVGSTVPTTLGSQTTLELLFDSTNLSAGDYVYNLTVAVSDEDIPGAGSDTLNVALTVTVNVALCADVNCDGLVDAFDIEPFILAILNPADYATTYPNCDIVAADINSDQLIDAFDIEPFIAAILNGGCPQ